jgi:hypothetical protein
MDITGIKIQTPTVADAAYICTYDSYPPIDSCIGVILDGRNNGLSPGLRQRSTDEGNHPQQRANAPENGLSPGLLGSKKYR